MCKVLGFLLRQSQQKSVCRRGALLPGNQRLGAADAVGRGGHDAPGVARALAAGIEPGKAGLQVLPADDAYRGGAAGLRRGQDCVGQGKSVQPPVQQRDGLGQGIGNFRRQDLAQVAPGDAGAVRRRDSACLL